MIPLQLYIENFLCHEKSYIDFTQFSTALIVGKIEGNDSYSNGVGKTTIFKAIEYVLFNSADLNLEKLIRDDTNSCKIIFDFKIGEDTYRASRSRTKKGSSDVSLYKRNSVEEDKSIVFDVNTSDKYWKDISGRRSADTDKDLAKLIKINAKSFRNTVHFAQNDFTGLTTATPEKRKSLLKESLSLSVYSKLEKISKEQSSSLTKEIDRLTGSLNLLGNPEEDILNFEQQIILYQSDLNNVQELINSDKENLLSVQNSLAAINEKINQINNDSKSLLQRKERATSEKEKLDKNIKESSIKKNKILEEAKNIANNLKSFKDKKENMTSLSVLDLSQLSKDLDKKREDLADLNSIKKSLNIKIAELSIPLPDDSLCKHCRQELTKEHLDKCKEDINTEIKESKKELVNVENKIKEYTASIKELSDTINKINKDSRKLQEYDLKIQSFTEDLNSKKSFYEEYNILIKNLEKDLIDKSEELNLINKELESSSFEEINNLNEKIKNYKEKIEKLNNAINGNGNKFTSISNSIAVNNHSIEQKKKDIGKKTEISLKIKELNKNYELYPKVIEAFSSRGIPNLIIQNLLDDLQEEANKLLNNLKPGLQLQFLVEKEKKSGELDDTLDILYFVQGKPRDYEQLSGAMKLAVNFSLKIGLSFLLQKTFDTNINFLLLDEIDQSLDKAGVDAFADIVKFFQKDFTIMVITHNDRLKDKFGHAILVEQNKDMVSTASVVTSW